MNTTSRISIAGHRGLVGSAILRNLQAKGYANFVLRTHAELDLENQAAVRAFLRHKHPIHDGSFWLKLWRNKP